MITIDCPNCGPRNSSEFRHCGESRPRPEVGTVTPQQWRAYLYLKHNPAGWTTESWYHSAGCRRYFKTERHTVTNEFRAAAGSDPGEGA